MREELRHSLVKEFPDLFGDNFWFECGDGWFDLIRALCLELKPLLPAAQAAYEDSWGQDCGKIRVDQVKEKFGGLRFYLSWTTDEMLKLISHYEGLSAETCEVCGKQGVFVKGKSQVLCEEHR